jgi:hypothetical protein
MWPSRCAGEDWPGLARTRHARSELDESPRPARLKSGSASKQIADWEDVGRLSAYHSRRVMALVDPAEPKKTVMPVRGEIAITPSSAVAEEWTWSS